MGVFATALELDDVARARVAYARQILLQAALLGILADSVLRDAPSGLGWTVWVLALSSTTLLLAMRHGDRLGREQAAWFGLTVAYAAAFSWRDAEMLQLGNLVATLLALALFAMSLAGTPVRSILAARIRDVIAASVYAARDALAGAVRLLYSEAALGSAVRSSAAERLPALRAAILTLPLLIVFGALLSRADPVFGSLFRFPGIGIEDVVSHLALAGIFAWTSAGWMRGALMTTGNRSAPDERLPFKLGVVEITTSLGALNALFGLFVGIQLRWLFGGAEVVRATTGLSLAEYARRGFFELVTVAALALPLILVTRAAISDDATALRRHRHLALSLLVLLGAIMMSALLRMQLYVANFGLTTDRLFASVFMGWLALVFLGMTLTVLRGWARPFAALTILSGFLTLLALNAANPEAIVARSNLARTQSSRPVDYQYLSSLSGDASGLVARALASAEPSELTCKTARELRARWSARMSSGASGNWGAAHGADVVLESLTPHSLRRLCGYSRTSPSASSSR